MTLFEASVVYLLSWWIVFLPILSVGTQSQEESGVVVPGSERGAPVKIGMVWKLLGATVGAGLVTFVISIFIQFGWLDFIMRPTISL
ncbi:MAG: DUF1467 family protein [Alphaproteobacteria bacterium]|nr:DUF1467 family protein [Alphaproteobacteria bacterium]